MEEWYSFTCPCCWQDVSMLLDLSAGGQAYVQDCEACCNPLDISFEVENGHATNFTVSAAQE
ncbi:MAG: CPXCG motif-containing cysteine-rich protein [Candidatus Hydrogenedentes bacterium]|nr:CPXCG motif-containing cysteine-rich protein [Candidatus Hydrogenedentota bacterium]